MTGADRLCCRTAVRSTRQVSGARVSPGRVSSPARRSSLPLASSELRGDLLTIGIARSTPVGRARTGVLFVPLRPRRPGPLPRRHRRGSGGSSRSIADSAMRRADGNLHPGPSMTPHVTMGRIGRASGLGTGHARAHGFESFSMTAGKRFAVVDAVALQDRSPRGDSPSRSRPRSSRAHHRQPAG